MDQSYLQYPKRGHGQDHDLYDWRLSRNRKPLIWDGGAKVALSFIIPLEFFPLNPSGIPFKHPGAMATPYPDLRHYTVRDYGNRVGVYRILDALGSIRAGFAVNAKVAERYPPLIEAIRDHEIIAHGVSTDHIHHEGLSEAEEDALIAQTLSALPPVKGWISPARNQSSRTLERLSKAGLSYCLDWENDSVPVATSPGVTLLPNAYELSDFTLLHTRRQTEDSWQRQILDAVDYLASEFDRYGAQSLCITLTPYIIGQPFRIAKLAELLTQLQDRDDVAILTPGDVASQFKAQL
jgi:peptidoglycan/xylan/chitin deacetylase (PgdA/CDA1 family)